MAQRHILAVTANSALSHQLATDVVIYRLAILLCDTGNARCHIQKPHLNDTLIISSVSD